MKLYLLSAALLMVLIFSFFLPGCGPTQPKLRVVMGLGEEEWKVMRTEIFPPFEKENGVKIEGVQLEASDLSQVLKAQVEAQRVEIDLFAQDNMQLSYLVNHDLVEDLSPYAAEIPRAVVPALLSAGKFKGKLYFFPYRPNVQITYYNRQKFAAYRLLPPRNWEELLKAARVLKQKEGVGKVLFKAYGGVPTATQLYEWIVSAGGDPFAINDEGCVKTFEFLIKLWPYLSPDSIRAKFDTTNEYLARDSAYLAQNWPFGIRVIIKEYGKSEIATYHGFSGPLREAHVIGGEVLGLPKGAPQRELALRFVYYLQSKEVQEKLVSRLGWPSIRTDAYGTLPEWMRPHFDSVSQALKHGVLRKNVDYWEDYVKYINDAFIEIVQRGAPLKKTLDVYHAKLEAAKHKP